MSVRDANGTVETLGPESGTIRLDDGGLIWFTWRHCYRDGTSFYSMRIGDRVRFDADKQGISSPNTERWGQGARA